MSDSKSDMKTIRPLVVGESESSAVAIAKAAAVGGASAAVAMPVKSKRVVPTTVAAAAAPTASEARGSAKRKHAVLNTTGEFGPSVKEAMDRIINADVDPFYIPEDKNIQAALLLSVFEDRKQADNSVADVIKIYAALYGGELAEHRRLKTINRAEQLFDNPTAEHATKTERAHYALVRSIYRVLFPGRTDNQHRNINPDPQARNKPVHRAYVKKALKLPEAGDVDAKQALATKEIDEKKGWVESVVTEVVAPAAAAADGDTADDAEEAEPEGVDVDELNHKLAIKKASQLEKPDDIKPLFETPLPGEPIEDEAERAKWIKERAELDYYVEGFTAEAEELAEKSIDAKCEEAESHIYTKEIQTLGLRALLCHERSEAIKVALLLAPETDGGVAMRVFGDCDGSDSDISRCASSSDRSESDDDAAAAADPDATESDVPLDSDSEPTQPVAKRTKRQRCTIHPEVELNTAGKCVACVLVALAERKDAREQTCSKCSQLFIANDDGDCQGCVDKQLKRELLEADLEAARLTLLRSAENEEAAKVTKRQAREAAKAEERVRKLAVKEALRKEKMAAAVARAAEFADWPKCIEHPTFPVNEFGCTFCLKVKERKQKMLADATAAAPASAASAAFVLPAVLPVSVVAAPITAAAAASDSSSSSPMSDSN